MYIVEFSNRVLVFIQWGFLYLTYNQGARLITGSKAAETSHQVTDASVRKPPKTEIPVPR